MSFLGWDPGDPNNWYQSPQLGLFPVSPAGYGGGISGACCLTHSSHPHGSPSYPPPPPFPFQPSYSPPPPPPPPSQTIINGYVFPHQFPCVSQTHAQFNTPPQLQPIYPTAQQPLTTTPQSPSIPHSNPNPWIYTPISQSHSCDPHSQFVSTKPMTTTPIHHSAPSPPVCEKPHSPPQDSSILQAHKQHTEAKLCEMRESLKSSMDTFISEFREELRLLRGSLRSPTSQVDNPLKFCSPPPSSTPQLIPAATEASASLIHADNGIIRKTPVDNDLNLSHTDVILGFNDNTSMDNIVGFVCGTKLNGIDEKLDTGDGENSDEMVKVNSGDGREFNEVKGVTPGTNPYSIKKGIGKTVQAVINELENKSRLVKGCNDLTIVTSMSAGNDKQLGKMIVTAIDKAGQKPKEKPDFSVPLIKDESILVESTKLLVPGALDWTTILHSNSNGSYHESDSGYQLHSPTSCETKSSKCRDFTLDGLWDDSSGLPTMKTKFKSFCKSGDDGRLRNYGLVDAVFNPGISILFVTLKLMAFNGNMSMDNERVQAFDDVTIGHGHQVENWLSLSLRPTSSLISPLEPSILMVVGDTSSGYIQIGVPQSIIKDAQYVEISASDLIKWDKAKMGYYVGIDMANGFFLGNSMYWIQFNEEWIVLLHVFKSLEEEYGMELIFVRNSYEFMHEHILAKFKLYWLLQYLLLPAAKHSLRYSSAPIILMSTSGIHSVVHIIFQDWLLLIHEHERDFAKSTVLPNSPSLTRVAGWFPLKYIFNLLLAMIFGVTSAVFDSVILATTLVTLKYKKDAQDAICHVAILYVAFVLFLHMQLVGMCLPPQTMEFPRHYLTQQEIAKFWIWLPTTLLRLQTKDNMVQNFEGAISTWGCSAHKNETKIMLPVPQVECKVDVLKILHFLFTPVVHIASLEASGAIKAYHVELKVNWFADSHLGALQKVDSLVHKLTTELHSSYWLDQYDDKCDSFHNVNEECIGSKSWHRALQISDSAVTLDDKSRLFAKVSSQKNSNIIHLVWIPGSEFSFCDYVWSMEGNICKHATKVNMICEGHQGWPYALITTAVSEISEISRLVISAISKKTCNPHVSIGQLSFGGLVNEEHFEDIKASVILPVMCYYLMHLVYAKIDRWDDAAKLLNEMLPNRVSNIPKVMEQMIKGDYDGNSNWQMVEYVFDKLKSDECGLGMRFYNTLIEAFWWLGQKQRAKLCIFTSSHFFFPPPGTKTSSTDVDSVRYNGTSSDATSRTIVATHALTTKKLLLFLLTSCYYTYNLGPHTDTRATTTCGLQCFLPRREWGADVISSYFSLLNVDYLADQFVALVDFLGLKKVLSLGGDMHDGAGTIWKIIQA